MQHTCLWLAREFDANNFLLNRALDRVHRDRGYLALTVNQVSLAVLFLFLIFALQEGSLLSSLPMNGVDCVDQRGGKWNANDEKLPRGDHLGLKILFGC